MLEQGEPDSGLEAGKGGRPTKFQESFIAQAAKLCALGATDDELADFFDIHRATLYRWKLDHPEFCDALKAAKDVADDRVERSLYHKAVGYDVTEEQVVKLKSEQFQEVVEVVEVRKHVPAETTAAIFWLKNRRKDEWRDRQEHTGADGAALVPVPSDTDLARLIAFQLTRASKGAE